MATTCHVCATSGPNCSLPLCVGVRQGGRGLPYRYWPINPACSDSAIIRRTSMSSRVFDMPEVTQILSRIEAGDPSAAEQLLPILYDELKKLAVHRLANEKPGQTLQATALVHEAYLRLVDGKGSQHWNSRGHFFAAAAEAMRRILVEQRPQKTSQARR